MDDTAHEIEPDDALIDYLEHEPCGTAPSVILQVREDRAVGFEARFRERFGEHFYLLTAAEVLELELMGPGPVSPVTRRRMGNYLAVSTGAPGLYYNYPRTDAGRPPEGRGPRRLDARRDDGPADRRSPLITTRSDAAGRACATERSAVSIKVVQRDVGQGLQPQVGLVQPHRARHRIWHDDAEHARSLRRGHAVGRVLDGYGGFRLDAQYGQGGRVELGIGLCRCHVVAAAHRVEVAEQLSAGELTLHPVAPGARRDAELETRGPRIRDQDPSRRAAPGSPLRRPGSGPGAPRGPCHGRGRGRRAPRGDCRRRSCPGRSR